MTAPGVTGAGVVGGSVVPGGTVGAVAIERTKHGPHGQGAESVSRFEIPPQGSEQKDIDMGTSQTRDRRGHPHDLMYTLSTTSDNKIGRLLPGVIGAGVVGGSVVPGGVEGAVGDDITKYVPNGQHPDDEEGG